MLLADLEIIFMDAGQGDCTLIVYPDESLTLIDCGSTKSGAFALAPIKEVIDRKFNDNTDFSLVLTHPDQDHFNLLHNLDVQRYLDGGGPCNVHYGGSMGLYETDIDNFYTYSLLEHFHEHQNAFPPENQTSTEPDTLLSRAGKINGVNFQVNVTILAANCTGRPGSYTEKNENSIVLLVEYEGAKIFLMGDATSVTEKFIIDAYRKAGKLARLQKQPGEHVVLKVGHHGSTTSSSLDWLNLIQPDVIVVSSGTKRFGKGPGIPKESHLNTIIQRCPLEQNTGISQTYVVFDDRKDKWVFAQRPATTRGIWTTCYNAELQGAVYFESGQTWYYGVGSKADKKKKIPHHWVGYTGYDT